MSTSHKQSTKDRYKEELLNRYKQKKNSDFNINKISVSKNDPVISTVNKVLESIR